MNIFDVNMSDKEITLTANGCVFQGQERLDSHEIDPNKDCYCGRPNKKSNPMTKSIGELIEAIYHKGEG